MGFIFDGTTRTITEERAAGDPALVEYSVLNDLYIAAATWWDTGDNSKYYFPFRISGGGFRRLDSEGNELFATADIFLQNQAGQNWRLVAADYEHIIRFSSANLFREDASSAMWDLDQTAADVVVEFEQSDVNTVIKTAGEAGTGLTAAQINAIGDAIAARTPQAIWEYANRTLTDLPPASATASALQAVYLLLQDINNKVDQGDIRLSAEQLGRISSAVWQETARTLTITPITPNDIWAHGDRTLTGQEAGTLTNAQVDAISTAIWAASGRGIGLDEICKLLGLVRGNAVTAVRDGDSSYVEAPGIRLNMTQTVDPSGRVTVVQERQP